MSKPRKLSEKDKASVRKDFREWSGGYHPGEAADEHEKYLDLWEETYDRDDLDLFLTQWGEEESEKDAKKFKKEEAARAEALKKRLHEVAKSCVTMNEHRTQVTVKVDDVTLYLPTHQSKTKAKAEWADCVWALETMLRRGAEEAGK